jgi:hypothetical protein
MPRINETENIACLEYINHTEAGRGRMGEDRAKSVSEFDGEYA